MPATLRLVHKAIGAEVRRGTYDVMVDGMPAGSVEMNEAIDIPVEPGRHILQVRNGRNSSRTKTFDVAEDEIVAFRCTGKSILPIFLLSFIFPAWHSGSVASSPPCASPPPHSEPGAQASSGGTAEEAEAEGTGMRPQRNSKAAPHGLANVDLDPVRVRGRYPRPEGRHRRGQLGRIGQPDPRSVVQHSPRSGLPELACAAGGDGAEPGGQGEREDDGP